MKRSAAEIVREYGPFPGVDRVNGVTYDGQHVWFASGDKLNAFDPASGKTAALDRRRRACRNGVRRPAPVPDRRGPHPEDRSEDRPRARHDPGARRRRRLRARLGRRHAVGGAVSRPEDPSGRSRDRRDPSHHRVQPLRHRGHLGRRRALARHLGSRRERAAARRSRTGEVLEQLEMPPGVGVSGLESDGGDRFFCGGGSSGKVRAVRRPTRGARA